MPRFKVYGTREVKIEAEVVAADEIEAEEILFTAYTDGLTVGQLDGLLSYQDTDEPWFFDAEQLSDDEE